MCAAPSERTSSALWGAAHTGDLGTEGCRDLDGIAGDPAGGPLIRTRCPARTLPTSWIARSAVVAAIGSPPLLERKARWLEHHLAHPSPGVLRRTRRDKSRAPRRRPKARARPRQPPPRCPPHRAPPRRTSAWSASGAGDQPGDQRVTVQHMPVVGVQPGGVHPHQHAPRPILGGSMSASRNTSGGPNRSWTIAFITSHPAPCHNRRHGHCAGAADRFAPQLPLSALPAWPPQISLICACATDRQKDWGVPRADWAGRARWPGSDAGHTTSAERRNASELRSRQRD